MDDAAIAAKLAELDSRSKSNTKRIDECQRQISAINSLATSVAVMAEKLSSTSDKVDELCTDVKSLKDEPAEKWQLVVRQVITILISCVGGYILASIGMR